MINLSLLTLVRNNGTLYASAINLYKKKKDQTERRVCCLSFRALCLGKPSAQWASDTIWMWCHFMFKGFLLHHLAKNNMPTNDLLIDRQAIALYTTCRTLNFVLTPIWVRKKQARILSLVELTHLRGGPDHKRYLRLIDPNKRSQV